MKLELKAGTTSQRILIFVQDSSSAVGAGLTGLTNASSGLAWYYWREDTGNAGGSSVSPASATRGTWTSGGFKEVDSTNLPGVYELGVPDAVLASGAKWACMMLRGVTNMARVLVEFELTAYDPFDSTRLGLSAVPAGPTAVKKNQTLTGFTFRLSDSSGVAVTGLGSGVTATRSIDGGSFASCANAVAEISGGWYKITLAAADLNGTVIALQFSGSGALDTTLTIITQQ